MENNTWQNIAADVQEKCDAFCVQLKEEKKRQGLTNRDLADDTGIPLSNVNKFMAGNISNPSFFYMLCACVRLGISVDAAFDLSRGGAVSESQELAECRREIEYLRADKANITRLLRAKEMTITVLFGICVLLIVALAVGLIYDSVLPEAGFIRRSGIAAISIVLIAVVVLAIAATVHAMIRNIYRN